jgi:nucleotide-binding universal stress UspA family protein
MTPRSPHGPILVGYDGSDESRDALALAKQLARATDSWLLLAWIEPVGPFDLPYEVVLEPIQERAERALDEVARDLRDQDFEVGMRVGLLGSAAQGIHELAESESAELIVVGSSHRGRLGQAVAGTVGKRLLHGAACPVAIAPRGFAQAQGREHTTVGVAYDGSPEARAALEEARYLALKMRATLKVIAVAEAIGPPHETIDPETFRRASKEAAHAWLDEARASLRDDFTVVTETAVGAPEHELEAASAELDLLVLGSRGYGPVRRVLLGSVSSHLVEHCHCPLVVVPRGSEVSEIPHRVLFGRATAS